jgi:hypothetical protein
MGSNVEKMIDLLSAMDKKQKTMKRKLMKPRTS